MSRRATDAWMPEPADEWLIRAAAGQGPEVTAAWRRWRSTTTLDDARHEAALLLPAVYRNLSAAGAEDPEMARLRGIYRYAWSRNQLLFRTGANAIRVLEGAGLDPIVLKGAALSALAYRDKGARQMTDFDLLVPRERALDAIAAFEANGIRPHEAFPDPVQRVSVHHSTAFVDPRNQEIDLHWYVLFQSSPDDDVWDAAVPIEIDGVQTRTLCPADQLLQVCGHGAQWSPTGSLRWIVDSLVLLREDARPVDWDRLAEQTIRRRLTPTILDALEYLEGTFDAPVPSEVLDQLRAVKVPLQDTLARRAARAPINQRRILITQWDRYRRLKRLDPTAPRQPSFPAQLKAAWGAPSYLAFSRHAFRRLLRI